jgi:hypothetical protein
VLKDIATQKTLYLHCRARLTLSTTKLTKKIKIKTKKDILNIMCPRARAPSLKNAKKKKFES